MNVTAPNSTSIDFYYDDGSVSSAGSDDTASNGYYTTTWDSSNAGTGDFDLIAGNGTENATISVTGDFKKPSIDSKSPADVTSKTSPSVSFSASDTHSSVNSSTAYIKVEDSNGNVEGEANSTSVDVSDLSDGDYDVTYNIADTLGNWNNNTWTFTVDTSYDGDTSASFEHDDGYAYLMSDDDDDFDFDVDLGDSSDEDSDIKLKCFAGSVDSSNLLTETDYENVGSNGRTYDCEIPGDDYTDEAVDIIVKAYDEAGNNEKVGEVTYYMDLSAPDVSEVESAVGTSTFNDDFDVTFDASDSATSVSKMEYFFDDATVDEGDGTSIEGFDDGEFTADVSDLESGNHTLYLRAKDEAGRWSGPQSYDFEYYPNAEPDISLTVPGEITMTAANESEIEITVENTGKLVTDEFDISFSDLFVGSTSVGSMEPGEDVTVPKSFTPEESDIGKGSLTVSAERFNVSKKISVRVKASASQQESISSRLSTYQSKLESLRSNTSSLESKLNDNLKNRLDSNVSGFESKVEDAESAIEAGEYYKAQEALSNIDTDYSAAKTSYESVKEQHKKNKQRTLMLSIIGLVLVAVLGGGAYAYHEGMFDDYEFDEDLDLTVVSEKLGDLGSSEDEEEDEDEFAWDGFS